MIDLSVSSVRNFERPDTFYQSSMSDFNGHGNASINPEMCNCDFCSEVDYVILPKVSTFDSNMFVMLHEKEHKTVTLQEGKLMNCPFLSCENGHVS